jgi:hypothetical protein
VGGRPWQTSDIRSVVFDFFMIQPASFFRVNDLPHAVFHFDLFADSSGRWCEHIHHEQTLGKLLGLVEEDSGLIM